MDTARHLYLWSRCCSCGDTMSKCDWCNSTHDNCLWIAGLVHELADVRADRDTLVDALEELAALMRKDRHQRLLSPQAGSVYIFHIERLLGKVRS